jgi:hypothetical protein
LVIYKNYIPEVGLCHMTIYLLVLKVSIYGDISSIYYCFLYFLTCIFAVLSGIREIVCFQDVRNQDLQLVPITFCASVRTLQVRRKKRYTD